MRSRVDPALLSALAVGLVVRLARIARVPLLPPDGPAYLLAWLVVLVRAQGTVGLAAAGALAGAAYLARPEGVLLVPLGVAWAVRRQHRAALVAYVVAALLVMSPALVALHARSGLWQL